MQLVKSSIRHEFSFCKNLQDPTNSDGLFQILLLSCNFKKGKEAPERNSSFVKILNQIIFLLCVAFSEIKVGKRSEILKFAKVFF